MNRRSNPPSQPATVEAEDLDFGAVLARQQRAAFESAGEMTEQGLRFLSDCISATADYLGSLRRCETAPDAMSLSTQYMSDAINGFVQRAQEAAERFAPPTGRAS
ncbi:MAG: phasin family protein [Burkholderiaceae bacterium]|nr:phasin family protein [Ideonella sp.]MCC7285978.1 phasin family protein [Burkholderiaceae bacterium]